MGPAQSHVRNEKHPPRCAERTRLDVAFDLGDPMAEQHATVLAVARAIEACCGHHRIKCFRLAHGWTVDHAVNELRTVADQLAATPHSTTKPVGLTRRSWLEWEAGDHHMRRYYQDLLCRLFRTGPVELGLATDHSPIAVSTHSSRHAASEDETDVLRRVRALSRGVNPEVVALLQRDLRHTVARYENLDHSSLNPALVTWRSLLDSLLGETSRPRQRRDLFETACVTSGLLGHVAVGRGDFSLARAYCAEAFTLGDLAQDSNLQAWVRGLQSFCEYYAGHFDEALRLARDGLDHYARSGPQSVRLAVNGVARAMGKLGDADGTDRAVGEAYELMGVNAAPGGLPSSVTLGCYDEAQTACNAATAYVSLGMPARVQHYLDPVLPEIHRSGSPWSRSLVLTDLASSSLRAPDVDLDHASGLVLDALTISAERPVISVRQRAAEFVRDATARWGDTPQTRVVRDAVAATGDR